MVFGSQNTHLRVVGIHTVVTRLAVAVVLEIVDVVLDDGALHAITADVSTLVLKARAEHLVELVPVRTGTVRDAIQTVVGSLSRIQTFVELLFSASVVDIPFVASIVDISFVASISITPIVISVPAELGNSN